MFSAIDYDIMTIMTKWFTNDSAYISTTQPSTGHSQNNNNNNNSERDVITVIILFISLLLLWYYIYNNILSVCPASCDI